MEKPYTFDYSGVEYTVDSNVIAVAIAEKLGMSTPYNGKQVSYVDCEEDNGIIKIYYLDGSILEGKLFRLDSIEEVISRLIIVANGERLTRQHLADSYSRQYLPGNEVIDGNAIRNALFRCKIKITGLTQTDNILMTEGQYAWLNADYCRPEKAQ